MTWVHTSTYSAEKLLHVLAVVFEPAEQTVMAHQQMHISIQPANKPVHSSENDSMQPEVILLLIGSLSLL